MRPTEHSVQLSFVGTLDWTMPGTLHNWEAQACMMTEAQIEEVIEFLSDHQSAYILELHARLEANFDDF
jgi:hypothetical protein